MADTETNKVVAGMKQAIEHAMRPPEATDLLTIEEAVLWLRGRGMDIKLPGMKKLATKRVYPFFKAKGTKNLYIRRDRLETRFMELTSGENE